MRARYNLSGVIGFNFGLTHIKSPDASKDDEEQREASVYIMSRHELP